MKVTNMYKSTYEGAIKATFSVVLDNGMTLNDFKLVVGKKGPFVSPPSREFTGRDGVKKYRNIVEITPAIQENLFEQAQKLYTNGEGDGEDNWF